MDSHSHVTIDVENTRTNVGSNYLAFMSKNMESRLYLIMDMPAIHFLEYHLNLLKANLLKENE